jgi:FkbM family methyltransferase
MWSKAYSKRFERVYAFEPIEDNIRCVQLNAPEATVIPCALTDRPGYQTFKIKGANFAHLGEGEHSVFCTTIDSFEYKGLGLIKLDVEGQEVNALNGALQTLNKHRPVIMIEVKYDGDSVRAWLVSHGYEFQEGNGLDEIWTA